MAVSIDENSLTAEKIVEFFDNYILRAGSHIVNDAVNTGRRESAVDFDAKGAQYSAYLEGNVCDFCRALDGMTVRFDGDEGYTLFDKYSPAQHPNCNCFWVYILEGEKFEDDNREFEKKWMEEFRKRNPNKDWSKAKILDRYAQFNVYFTRSHLWKDDWNELKKIREEVIQRRLELIEKKFRMSVVSGLTDVGEADIYKIDYTDSRGNMAASLHTEEVEFTQGKDKIKINFVQAGKNDSEIDAIKEKWQGIPIEHLKDIKEVRIINAALTGKHQRVIMGQYNHNEKVIILPRYFISQSNNLLRIPIENMSETSLHELGHHYLRNVRDTQRDIKLYRTFKCLEKTEEYGIILGVKREYGEFFAEAYKLARIRPKELEKLDALLDLLYENGRFDSPYRISPVFNDIFGD